MCLSSGHNHYLPFDQGGVPSIRLSPAAGVSVFDLSQSNTRQLTCTGTGECCSAICLSTSSTQTTLCVSPPVCAHTGSLIPSAVCATTRSLSPQCHERSASPFLFPHGTYWCLHHFPSFVVQGSWNLDWCLHHPSSCT